MNRKLHKLAYLLLALIFITIAGCESQDYKGDVNTLKIYTSEEGIYELSASDLKSSNFVDFMVDPSQLKLFHLGKEQPLWIYSHGDEFYITFYAQESQSDYTSENVYWLGFYPEGEYWSRAGEESVQHQATSLQSSGEIWANTYKETVHLEENQIYLPQVQEGDHWFWAMFSAPQKQEFEFVASSLERGSALIRIAVNASTDSQDSPDHRLKINVNQQEVVDEKWDGKGRKIIEAEFSSEMLKEGRNTLSVEAPGVTGVAADIYHLDWIEVEYDRLPVAHSDRLVYWSNGLPIKFSGYSGLITAYDITEQDGAVRVFESTNQEDGFIGEIGHRYLVVGPGGKLKPSRISTENIEPDLKLSGNGADYIAIGPKDLLDPLQPLLEYREEQGLKTRSIPIEAVYDQFNYGIPEPVAIQKFMQYTQQNWDPAPDYLLLVGDASYDPKGYISSNLVNQLSTFTVDTVYGGETASDVGFVQINGDPWPDLAIGRVPAQNKGQVKTFVDKTLKFEQNLDENDYPQTVVAIAEGQDPHFDKDAKAFIDLFPDDVQSDVYTPLIGENNANEEVKRLFDGNLWMVAYFGHGSINMWGKEGLLSTEDVSHLSNNEHFPIVFNLTCLTGLYTHPEVESLAEALLWHVDGGAVAVLAPSSLTLPNDQSYLSDSFVEAITNNSGDATLGEIHLTARRQVPADYSGPLDVMRTFMLFGDPALRVARIKH